MTSFKAREYDSPQHKVAAHDEGDPHRAETQHCSFPVGKINMQTLNCDCRNMQQQRDIDDDATDTTDGLRWMDM